MGDKANMPSYQAKMSIERDNDGEFKQKHDSKNRASD